jgi:hypothetical protein
MISRIHSKLGTAGLVVAIVALVAALGGGAYAAQQGLNGKQKKEVKKIAKKFAGKPGAPGLQGPKGDTGAPGPAGKDGTNGTNGAPGQSVTGTAITAGGACGSQTGVKYTLDATSTNVCNGQTGFTDTLPPGKTETGVWAAGPNDSTPVIPLSFNIPLAVAPVGIHFVSGSGEEETEDDDPVTPVNCLGSAEEPEANPGHVCIYETVNFGATGWFYPETPGLTEAYRTGATFMYQIAAGQVATGSYAVTAATS